MPTADDIANKLIELFQVGGFKEIVDRFVAQKYQKGASEVEAQFDFNVQFGDAQRDISLLSQYTFDNIKEMTNELQGKLRQELQRGLLGNDTPAELRKRIADVFRGSNPTRFKFEDRMKMIARTEGLRATNMAKVANVQRLGRKGVFKYVKIIDDNRTSEICHAEDRKYGERSEAIPLDDDFIVRVGGKTFKAPYPPFHVMCRSSVILTQKGDERL